jgi:hypothetical protein
MGDASQSLGDLGFDPEAIRLKYLGESEEWRPARTLSRTNEGQFSFLRQFATQPTPERSRTPRGQRRGHVPTLPRSRTPRAAIGHTSSMNSARKDEADFQTT